MFEVIRRFKDTGGHIYEVGDVYPLQGSKKPSKARVKTLSSTDNKYGEIFIEKVDTPIEKE